MKSKNPENIKDLKLESKDAVSMANLEGNHDFTTYQRPQSPCFAEDLLEEVLSRSNLMKAYEKVVSNKGAPGIDGMTVEELGPYLRSHYPELESQLRNGKYRPNPVKRVEIPKPNGGIRKLGIPTVIDRFIQQTLLQVLQAGYDAMFSPSSYGFRPRRSAHMAVCQAKKFQEEGYKIVIDVDLEKFFDKVNHDKLMGRLRKDIKDVRILKLIRAFLNSGIMEDGVVLRNEGEGTPQGGPLSPLLSNIVLDSLDRELEKRGHKFARYADDCNIYVKTQRAGERVMKSITDFIERKLKLKVNQDKSKVDKPAKRKFLGFSFYNRKGPKIRVSNEALKKFKDKIRGITRPGGRALENVIESLRKYLTGWRSYFKLAENHSRFKELDSWIRHRLRSFIWQQWKRKFGPRYKNLLKHGVDKELARSTAASGKGAWRLSRTQALQIAFPVKYFERMGLPRLVDAYAK